MAKYVAALLSKFRVEANLDEKYLCARCKSLNLSNILAHPKRIKLGYALHVAMLHTPESWAIYSCPLCDLFYATLREKPASNNSSYYLYAFLSPVESEWSSTSYEVGSMGIARPMFLRLVWEEFAKYHERARDSPSAIEISGKYSFGGNLFIAPVPKSSVPPLAGKTDVRFRSVGAKIDFRILRAWLEFCRREHNCQTSDPNFPPDVASHLRVIDCHTLQVVPAAPRCKYAALSYVWGDPPANDSQEPEHIFPALPEKLPLVIDDAIKVVRYLELRYLWVDRYCINQQDQDDKAILIRSMDLIYANAEFTIIAAAGVDPSYGLPGVGHVSRNTQPSANVGKHLLVSTLPDPTNLVRGSKWVTRGWTYQEAILSHRRLFFTDHQVYFECDAMRCKEVAATFPGSTDDYWTSRLFNSFRHALDLKQHIEHYSTLQFKQQSDILDGMGGIFRFFERLESPIYNYWGVPINPAPQTESDSARWTISFLEGLFWTHSSPCRRRTGFPSWSWSGWEGKVSFGGPLKHMTRFKFVPLDIWIELKNGDRMEWEQYQIDLTRSGRPRSSLWYANLTPYLHVQAQFIQIRFEYLPQGPPESARWLKSEPGFYFRYSIKPLSYCDLVLSKDIGEFPELYRRLQTESWDCIIIAEHESLPVVLVLDRKGDTAERIGFMNLAAHQWPQKQEAIVQSLTTDTPLQHHQMVLPPPPLPQTTRRIRLH